LLSNDPYDRFSLILILDFLGFTKARNVGEPFLLKMQEVIGVDL